MTKRKGGRQDHCRNKVKAVDEQQLLKRPAYRELFRDRLQNLLHLGHAPPVQIQTGTTQLHSSTTKTMP